jgi:hypothetical protein
LTLAELAGHAVLDPGPALASWLYSAPPESLDDAGLVASITAWRKLTSWAQAQEIRAVAELAHRRGFTVDGAPAKDGHPQHDGEGKFAPSELALLSP